MLKACEKHMHVPVVLGSRATDLPNKAAALVHSLRVETVNAEALQAILATAVSFTSDMGVESGLPDFPKVDLRQLCVAELPADIDIEDDVGGGGGENMNAVACAGGECEDSPYMFPHALMVCGVLHILANATSQVHERMGAWESFKPKLQVVAQFLHSAHYRSRLRSTCFGKQSQFSGFANYFNTGCPLPIEWRWLVTQQVLQHVLGLEHVLLAGWNLQAYLAGSRDGRPEGEEDEGYRGRQSESTVSLDKVDEALRSPDFWATCKMIWHVGESIRAMEGWSKACPTSPCSLCGSVSKTPKAHVNTCPVLFQSILVELLINGGIGQASGAGPVQTLITSGARTSQPGNGGLDRQQSGKTEQKTEAVDESGQARETRPQAPGASPKIGRRDKSGARRRTRCNTFFTGCRGTATDSSGLWVHMVRGHGAGQHPPCDVQHQQGVAQDSEHRPRSDQQTAVHYDDGVRSDGVQGKGDEDNAGPGYEGDGRVSGTVHRSGPVGVQKMEPGPKDPGVDEHPAPAFPDIGQHAGHNAEGHSGAGGAAQVPCVQAAARRYDWRQGGGVLHHTGGAPWCSGGETVCQPGAALRLHGASPAKEQTKAGKAADNRDRKSSGGSSAQAATKLQLRNSGNVCYVNTTVHMIAWIVWELGRTFSNRS